MQLAVRPYVTSGISLVGASVIAVSPVVVAPPDTPVLPSIPTSSTAVELTAVTNPITAWLDVLSSALGNATTLGSDWLSDPAPLLRQFLENQIGYAGTAVEAGQGVIEAFIEYINPGNPNGLVGTLQNAFEQLTSGDIAGAVETTAQAFILLPVLFVGLPLIESGLLDIPVIMAQNFANVVATLADPATVLPVALGALGSILGPINAFGDSLQAVFDSVTSLDPLGAVGALLSAPAVITGALINGYTSEAGVEFPGLLTVGDNPLNSGLLQSLLINLPRAIAAAIAPPAPVTEVTAEDTAETAAITATSTTAGTTVTLDVAPAAKTAVSTVAATEVETAVSEQKSGGESDGGAVAVIADDSESEETDIDAKGDSKADSKADSKGDSGDDAKAETGATDLTDGNKVTPGNAGGTESDGSSGDSDAGDGADTTASGASDAGDGSDSDSGSGDSE